MAEILKRQFDLFVLRLALDTAVDPPAVLWTIEASEQHQRITVDEWPTSAWHLGLPERLESRATKYAGYTFSVPDACVQRLGAALQAREQPGAPLWIHLARPTGYLRFVPWEALLQPALGVPILRLPEFLVGSPRTLARRLHVVVCASMPRAKDSFDVVEHVDGVVGAVISALGDRVRFDVFSEADYDLPLRQRWAARGLGEDVVRQHDPASAQDYAVPERGAAIRDQPDRLENPWLLWMRDRLRGRAMDVVHLLCHGVVSGQVPAISFSESPLRNEDARMARFVGAHELLTFSTQVGAWSTVFTSPSRNYSEMGLRGLAHTMAQLRPGPVVHHDLPRDGDLSALRGAYAFLHGPQPVPPPASPSLIVYCHPSQVSDRERAAARVRSALPDEVEEAADALCAEGLTRAGEAELDRPSWVAAANRFVEQRILQMKETSREEAALGRSRRGRDESRGSEEMLRRIQAVIATAASSADPEDPR
jgi:hypothetical protein